jgi:nucleoside-diphosphate-sugar epimerase
VPALRAAFPDADLTLGAFDVTDRAAIAAALRDCRPDICIHLAGVTSVGEAYRDPLRAWQVNLFGTLNVAWGLLEHAPACCLVLASTAEAYGTSFRLERLTDESAPLAPINAYSATKAAADLGVGALVRDGLRVIRLRPINHTGPGQSDQFVVAAFARQIARIEAGLQEPVIHVGALDPERDFLDVRDVCAAYVACVRRSDMLASGTILNLGSGVPRRIGDILDDLIRLAGVSARIALDTNRLRPSEIARAGIDATKARQSLDWAPRITWEATLRDVLRDWREREN